jgi:hypothetical protein
MECTIAARLLNIIRMLPAARPSTLEFEAAVYIDNPEHALVVCDPKNTDRTFSKTDSPRYSRMALARTSFGMRRFDKEFSRFRRARSRRTVKWPLPPDTLFITGRSRGFCALHLDIRFRGSGWLGRAARLNFVLRREQNSDSV